MIPLNPPPFIPSSPLTTQKDVSEKSRLQKNIFTRIAGISIGLTGYIASIPLIALGALASLPISVIIESKKLRQFNPANKSEQNPTFTKSIKKTAVLTFDEFFKVPSFFLDMIDKSTSNWPSEKNNVRLNVSTPIQSKILEKQHQVTTNLVSFAGEKVKRIISPIILSYESLPTISKVTSDRVASVAMMSDTQRATLLSSWKTIILAQRYIEKYAPVETFLSTLQANNLERIRQFLQSPKDFKDPRFIENQRELDPLLNQMENELEPFLEVILNEIERGNQGESMLHAKYLGSQGLNLSKKGVINSVDLMVQSLNETVKDREEFEYFRGYLTENLTNAYGIKEKRDLDPPLNLDKNSSQAVNIRSIISNIIKEKNKNLTESHNALLDKNLKTLVDCLYDILNGQEVHIPQFSQVKLEDIDQLKQTILDKLHLNHHKKSDEITHFLSHSLNAMAGEDFRFYARQIAKNMTINQQVLTQDQFEYLQSNLAHYFDPNNKDKKILNNYSGTKLKFPSEITEATAKAAYILQLAKNMFRSIPDDTFIQNRKNFENFTKELFENLYGIDPINQQIESAFEVFQKNSLIADNISEQEIKEYFKQILASISEEKTGLRPQIPKNSAVFPLLNNSQLLSDKQLSQLANQLILALNLTQKSVNKYFIKECIKEMQGTGFRQQAETSVELLLQECQKNKRDISEEQQGKLQKMFETLLNPMKTDRPIFFDQLFPIAPSEEYLTLTTAYDKEKYLSRLADKFSTRLIENKFISDKDKYFTITYMRKALFQLHGFSLTDQHQAISQKREVMSEFIKGQVQAISSIDRESSAISLSNNSTPAQQIQHIIAKVIDYREKQGKFLVSGFVGEPLKIKTQAESAPPKGWVEWARSGLSDLLFSNEEELDPTEPIKNVLNAIHTHFEQTEEYLGCSPSEIKKIQKQINKSVYEIFGFDNRFKLSEPNFQNRVIANWKVSLDLASNVADSEEITQIRLSDYLAKVIEELQFSSINGRFLCPKWPYSPLQEFNGISMETLKRSEDLGLDVDQMVVNLSNQLMSQVGKHFPEYEKCRNLVEQALLQIYGLGHSDSLSSVSSFSDALSEDLEKYITSEVSHCTNTIVDKINASNAQAIATNQQTFVVTFLENHALKTLSTHLVDNPSKLISTKISENMPAVDYELRYTRSTQIVDQLLNHFLPNGPSDIAIPEMELTQQAIIEFISSLGINVLRDVSSFTTGSLRSTFNALASNPQIDQNLVEKVTEISPDFVHLSTTARIENISSKILHTIPELAQETVLSFVDKRINPKLDEIKNSKKLDLHQAFHAALDALDSKEEQQIGKAFQVLVYHAIRSNMANKLYEVANQLDDPLFKMELIKKVGEEITEAIQPKKEETPPAIKEEKADTKTKTSISTSSNVYSDFGKALMTSLLPKSMEGQSDKVIVDLPARLVGKLAQKKVNKIITQKILNDVFNTTLLKVLDKVSVKTGEMQAAKKEGEEAELLESEREQAFSESQTAYTQSKEELKKFVFQKLPIGKESVSNLIDDLYNGIESTINTLVSGDLAISMVGELADFATKDE